MRHVSQKLKKIFYHDEEHPYRVYERIILSYIKKKDVVVDVGCGRAAQVLKKIIGECKVAIGMDIGDFEGVDGRSGINFMRSDVINIGLKNNSVDLIISRSMFEHIKDPDKVYRELYRVLKPGGYVIFLTPNLYDYASLIAKTIPNRFHPKIVRITEGRSEGDTFPTYFRSNTQRVIKNLSQNAGFKIISIALLGQYPSYLMFNPVLFLLGTAFDKIICKFETLQLLRGWLLVVLKKEGRVSLAKF